MPYHIQREEVLNDHADRQGSNMGLKFEKLATELIESIVNYVDTQDLIALPFQN